MFEPVADWCLDVDHRNESAEDLAALGRTLAPGGVLCRPCRGYLPVPTARPREPRRAGREPRASAAERLAELVREIAGGRGT